MNIYDLDISSIREKLLSKEITCVEILNEYIKNAKENNYNEFITTNFDQALNKAQLIDEKIDNGEQIGELAGIIVSVKDNIITKDLKTTAGSKMLEDFIPPYNATVIEKIINEDAIIIGKTNMPEFALTRSGDNKLFKNTINPIDKEMVSGGSSSGSAASVKASSSMISLASDTGGSIRQPASYQGLVGLKPTYGRVSRYGLISLSDSLDSIGIIGNNVKDAFILLNNIQGFDSKDLTTLDSEKINLDQKDISGFKVAVIKELLEEQMDRENLTQLNKAVTTLKENGVIVEEISIENIKSALSAFNIIFSSDVSSNLARYDGIRYGYRAKDYDSLDQLYMKTRKEGFEDNTKKRILFGTYLLSGDRGRIYYDKALEVRQMLIEEFNNIFNTYDAIIGLSSSMSAYNINDIKDRKIKDAESLFLTYSNLLGLCSISVPSKNDGMPIGIQFTANKFEEQKLYNISQAYERMVNDEL